MSAVLLDGKALAARLRARTAGATAAWIGGGGARPALAVVLVGEDPASAVYVRNKTRALEEAGMTGPQLTLPATTSEAELLALVARLNADPAIHGILVQLPLPAGIDASRVIQAIDPAKDVDGFHPLNFGRLAQGLPALVACTPRGCLHLIDETGLDLAGRLALVIGRSTIVGRPVAQLLLQRDCTVVMAHSRSRDLPALARQADILVAAAGRPELVRGSWIRPGAVVIDVGINRVEGRQGLVGDVHQAEAAAVAGWLSPVPGGVGPMTVACLVENTLAAARAQAPG